MEKVSLEIEGSDYRWAELIRSAHQAHRVYPFTSPDEKMIFEVTVCHPTLIKEPRAFAPASDVLLLVLQGISQIRDSAPSGTEVRGTR